MPKGGATVLMVPSFFVLYRLNERNKEVNEMNILAKRGVIGT